MQIKLAPTRFQNDAFAGLGDATTLTMPEVSDSIRSLKLHEEPFLPATVPPRQQDPFCGLGDAPVSRSTHFEKINLVPVPRDEGCFDGPTSGGMINGDMIKLAPLEKGGDLFELFGASPEPDASFTKGAEAEFHKFCQFTKVQETGDGNVLVWGIATLEQPDLDNEICHYDTAKDAYQAWSDAAKARTSGAGQELSLGNIRYQHSIEPAGKATKLKFDDDAKEIWLGSVPINDDVRGELQKGFLTGYSQGGSYAWRKCTDCGKDLTLQQANNYCANCKKQVPVMFGLKRLSEVSYVDSPCTGKGFDYVQADGSQKFVAFTKRSDRPQSDDVEILKTTRISSKIWACRVRVGGRLGTVVSKSGEIVLVA